MTTAELIKQIPAYLSTDQCHIISTEGFPKTYKNEKNKRINIEVYFNGSVVAYNGELYFCCRGDQKPWFSNIRLIICKLNNDFQPIKGTARFLDVGSSVEDKGKKGEFRVEDPRLFTCAGELHLAYGDGYEVYHALLRNDFSVLRYRNITNFSIKINENDGREKNWCPFEYLGVPHFIYSDNPRVIWCPFNKTAHISEQNIEWKYGQIRGGTPAIRYKDEYITFFHSAINASKAWESGRVYSMGAYTFSKEPPFKVTKMTQIPLVRGEKLHDNVVLKPNAVVFPSGVIQNEDSFFISMGINDSCTGVLRIQKTLLNSALIPL